MPTPSNKIGGGWTKRQEADWKLFNRSEAFRRIRTLRPRIETALRTRPMKVLPVRSVARLFEVSERLLWKWVAQDVLSTRRRPAENSEHYKKGITLRVVQEFLRRVDRCGEMQDRIDECRDPSRRRIRTRRSLARVKCQEGEKLLRDWTPTPRQYAEAVGVSVSTVYRMLRDGRLHSFRPTRKRLAICHFLHKNRNKLLTPKLREIFRKGLQKSRESPANPSRRF